MWMAGGLAGMRLVSPGMALIRILVLGGGWFLAREHRELSGGGRAAMGFIFRRGLFFLPWSGIARGMDPLPD